MLQSIDTLIAFVLIMTVASLFVTVVVQMLSAALSLRGKNLSNALALTFQTIAPELEGDAHQLAARILSDPLLSDSAMTEKDRRRAASGGDRHQPWHFTDMRCATALASAIRPEEAYAALKRLVDTARADRGGQANSGALRDPDERITKAAEKVLKALTVPEDEAAAIRARLSTFVDLAEQISEKPVKEKLLQIVEDTPAQLMMRVDAARTEFEKWFGSAQDRAQQWFQLHTRGLTIAASALIALILQLDAVEIFHHVSTNSASRAALVATVDRVVEQSDRILEDKGGLLRRIADLWATKAGEPAVDVTGLSNVEQLKTRLVLEGRRVEPATFDAIVRDATEAYYQEQRQKLTGLTNTVRGSGFEFIPVGYWRWPSPAGPGQSARNIVRHLPGIALFAALLTLGAPYWYNLLKNLASLRPAVAQTISKEEAARQPEKP